MHSIRRPQRTRPASLAQACVVALCTASTLARAQTQNEQDGLKIDITKAVKCVRPSQSGDRLSMHYNGTLTNGTPFDSSHDRGVPFSFVLGQGQVIKGWDYGLQDMCVGEERLLTIPPSLGYGSRDLGDIPPDSTLVFETLLVHIEGVEDEPIVETAAAPTPAATDAEATHDSLDAALHDELDSDLNASLGDHEHGTLAHDPDNDLDSNLNSLLDEEEDGFEAIAEGSKDGPASSAGSDNGECKLLGPFALLVQGALGLLALVSLVFKRWRERPRRPLKIWFFDASKQVFGSALLHVFNVLMSMLSSGAVELATQAQAGAAGKGSPDANPCSFYLINIAVDTTVGIPILVLLLKVLHQAALITPLANPPESIKSGYYGTPARATWWLKQAFIYSLGLLLMKLCVLFIFDVLPWIVVVGNWALRWTEGSEALQIAFVMFVFPLIMNAIQYYIVDTFIKDSSREPHGHEALATEEGDDDDEAGNVDRRLQDDESEDELEVGNEEAVKGGVTQASGSQVIGEHDRRR